MNKSALFALVHIISFEIVTVSIATAHISKC